MGLALQVFTHPPKEPVSLEEAKAHLRVQHALDDAYIRGLIKSARVTTEEHLSRALVETEFDYQLDAFPCGPILLPRPPLLSVTSISYVDLAGDTQVWSPSGRRVDSVSEPARITPTYLGTYPSTQPVAGAVTVRFKAGYCAAADDPAVEIPEVIRLAILMEIHKAYAHRNPVVVGTIVSETKAIRDLLVGFEFKLPSAPSAG